MITSRRRSPESRTIPTPNLEYVLELSPSAMTLGLDNIRRLLALVGNPQDRFRSIVVAGTNGKGSVVAMTASLLAAEGLKVGRLTSPHVYDVTERIWIDGDAVTREDLERVASRIVPLYGEVGYSYFEALTAMAFLLFEEARIEVAVLETGLGGRFDATNVVDPVVTVITSIALDHRRILGDTEEEILMEKLGITRAGVPLLVGDLEDRLRERVYERGKRSGFPVSSPGDLGRVEPVAGRIDGIDVHVRTLRADYGLVALPFAGAHQCINALLAVAAAERVCDRLDSVRSGLAAARLPGRLERSDVEGRTFLLDVAHNDTALCALARHVAAHSPRDDTTFVFGLLKRKELYRFPEALVETARKIYLVEVAAEGRDDEYAPHELLAGGVIEQLTKHPTDVILWNRRDAQDDHWTRLYHTLLRAGNVGRLIVVAGSHHVVDYFGRRWRLGKGR